MATIDPTDEESDNPECWPTTEDEELLPETFDQLVPTKQLVHGEHNPRKETPSDGLQDSIGTHGVEHSSIVHQPETGVYRITDGWQHYQAALNAGWEQFTVELHATVTVVI